MKRNLLLLGCLLSFSCLTFAQKKNAKKDPPQEKLTIPGSASLRPPVKAMDLKFDYKQVNAPMPQFDIFNHQNENITKDVLDAGGNIIMMVFNPVCDHCENQTKLFIDNIDLFKKSRLLLVAAPVQVPNLSYFESNVKFSLYKNLMTVSVDSAKVLDKIFNYVELPQINIYDGKTHRLLKTFNSLQPLDSLRSFIQ